MRFTNYFSISTSALLVITSGGSALSLAQSAITPLRVVVNSNQDGVIKADDGLTLREAIALVNGTISQDQLSPAEKAQISPANKSEIAFNLPAEQTTIRLTQALPPLSVPVLVDGTTQQGYDATKSATAEIAIPIPVVQLTPESDREVFRGLSIAADGVTVRGLALYGFTSNLRATATTPPADIFIGTASENYIHYSYFGNNLAAARSLGIELNKRGETPPRDVVIENNWLGILPDESVPQTTSAFGVSVFNSLGTNIRRNRISNHDGSAIITGVNANSMQVSENIIVGNGIAGMPDAIRLEGAVDKTQISGNLICGNDGSGVYLFKPDGAVSIRSNQIKFNSRRLQRAAVYLMGNNHQVIENDISHQVGAGVAVASYPKSDRNIISGNRFNNIDGLSIDLVTQSGTDVTDFQRGDGPNPERNSRNRRKDTGNASINAPEFISKEFFVLGNKTTVMGKADPGSRIEIYRVQQAIAGRGLGSENSLNANAGALIPNRSAYGDLREVLTTVEADEKGQFSATVDRLQAGERVSAIASNPKYGTSEPAINAAILSNDGSQPPLENRTPPEIPKCTSAPPPPEPPIEPTPPEIPPTPIRIQVPTNVHFALDKDIISPESAQVLDRIATVLREQPTIVVELQGHTDPRASNAYNLNLSNRRAIAARNYLRRQGIAPERMRIRAFGESLRRTEGNTRLDYARDRRVEFIFSDARGIELIVQEEDLQLER